MKNSVLDRRTELHRSTRPPECKLSVKVVAVSVAVAVGKYATFVAVAVAVELGSHDGLRSWGSLLGLYLACHLPRVGLKFMHSEKTFLAYENISLIPYRFMIYC